MRVNIYTDGSSRGNPGFSSYAFVVCNEAGEVLHEASKYLGVTTNNVAEYEAIIAALDWLSTEKSIIQATFLTDSEVVLNQITGVYKIKYSYPRKRAEKISEMVSELRKRSISIKFEYIPSERNLADEKAKATNS